MYRFREKCEIKYSVTSENSSRVRKKFSPKSLIGTLIFIDYLPLAINIFYSNPINNNKVKDLIFFQLQYIVRVPVFFQLEGGGLGGYETTQFDFNPETSTTKIRGIDHSLTMYLNVFWKHLDFLSTVIYFKYYTFVDIGMSNSVLYSGNFYRKILLAVYI